MKRIGELIILILITWGMFSCDDWLEVDPEFEEYEETMFEKEQGVYMALNGIYQYLSADPLYGKELLYGAIEAWGRSYALDEYNHRYYYWLTRFDYENEGSQAIATGIWEKSYRVIAEVNNLIQNVEAKKDLVFTGGERTRNMVLAEAYAIRALMHFELVRIFAKAPIVDQGGESAMVPYVTKFPSKVNTPQPTKNILQNILRDLEQAKIWIKPFDTDTDAPGYQSFRGGLIDYRLKGNSDAGVSGLADIDFFRFRAHHLNYYAITQLIARVALYAGDKDKAFTHAHEIVEYVKQQKPFRFTTLGNIGDPSALTTCDPKYSEEILFGGYNEKLPDWVEAVFWNSAHRWQMLRVNDKMSIFDNNVNDPRLKAIPSDLITKYAISGKDQKTIVKWEALLPILRIPEAFFIAAEAIWEKDKGKAVELFNTMVTARGNSSYQFSPNALPSDDDFMDAIVKEYRREYIGEGQLVYVYKRLNIPIRDGALTVDESDKLVMPIPLSEEIH